jgi:hypothetical protein
MAAILIPPQGTKVGISSSIGTTWAFLTNGTSITDPTGERAKVVSASTNDTSAGTGMQKVRIRYFDTNWILNDEIVTLNGTTSVLTVATNILRIDSFEAFQAGVFTTALGTITLTSTDGTRTFAQIDPFTTEFTRAIHTVSPGKIGNMVDISVNCTSAGGIIFSIFKEVDNTASGGGIVSIPDMIFSALNNAVTLSMSIPLTCDATRSTVGLRMGVAVKGLVATQVGSASFHYSES